jgi:NADH-quinone oxidoreductase subunit E
MSAPQTAAAAPSAAPQQLDTNAIIDKYSADRSCLIQILLELQQRDHWLSEEDLALVSRRLEAPLTYVYHVATFYKAFSLVPRGKHLISVCLGTACQVRGASRMLDRVTEAFKIKPGQTSPDKRFTLSTVNCLGCCALGPVMMIDDQYYSKPTKEELEQLAAAD